FTPPSTPALYTLSLHDALPIYPLFVTREPRGAVVAGVADCTETPAQTVEPGELPALRGRRGVRERISGNRERRESRRVAAENPFADPDRIAVDLRGPSVERIGDEVSLLHGDEVSRGRVLTQRVPPED